MLINQCPALFGRIDVLLSLVQHLHSHRAMHFSSAEAACFFRSVSSPDAKEKLYACGCSDPSRPLAVALHGLLRRHSQSSLCTARAGMAQGGRSSPRRDVHRAESAHSGGNATLERCRWSFFGAPLVTRIWRCLQSCIEPVFSPSGKAECFGFSGIVTCFAGLRRRLMMESDAGTPPCSALSPARLVSRASSAA